MTAPRVVMINESMARALFPNESPLGRRIGTGDAVNRTWAEVVGTFSDVAMAGNPSAPSTPFQVFQPLAQETWNYVAVHCTVTARLMDHDDPQAKDRLLKHLIADHDPAYARQWHEMDPELAQRLLAGIVAFELLVDDWQCKIKLNQHRPESHAALHAAYAAGNPDERALADWMTVLGMAPDRR